MVKEASQGRKAFVFVIVTLGLSFFVCWGPLALFEIPTISFVADTRGPSWAIALFILGGFVPSIAGILLTFYFDGKKGLSALWKTVNPFRLKTSCLLLAAGVIIAGTLGQVLLQLLMGTTFSFVQFYLQLPSLLPLLLLGPLSEAFGWRGFLSPHLRAKWNGLVSSIIVGFVWAFWHFPLFYLVGTSQYELQVPFSGFLVGLIAISILMTYFSEKTLQIVGIAVFLHWIYTYCMQVVFTQAVRSNLYNWLEYSPYIVLAGIVMLLNRELFFGKTGNIHGKN